MQQLRLFLLLWLQALLHQAGLWQPWRTGFLAKAARTGQLALQQWQQRQPVRLPRQQVFLLQSAAAA